MRSFFSCLAVLVVLASPVWAADATIDAAIANPARSAQDRERDVRDKPAELMAFAGIKPGMVIADIFGGGGYYSELFAYAVGPQGKVMLVNNVPYAQFAAEGLKRRFADNRLPGVERRLVETGYMRLPDNSIDLAVIVLSYHDLYYIDEAVGWPALDVDRFFAQIRKALKRGGRFLIVDHAAAAGSGSAPAQGLHRIDEKFAIKDITSRGFVLEKTWDGLRNPSDDTTKLVFDPAVRGKTDRFVHLYRKR